VALVFCILGAGCSSKFYRHSADKQTYQLIAQKGQAVDDMERHFTIDQAHALALDDLPVVVKTNEFLGKAAQVELGSKVLTLKQALGIAVKQSRDYQTAKENLFETGLALSLAEHQFAPIYAVGASGTYGVQTVQTTFLDPITGEAVLSDNLVEQASFEAPGSIGVNWLIRDVGRVTAAVTADFLKFVSGGPGSFVSSQVGATFTRPLVRNANFMAEMENLTQAERNLLYAVRNFVRFRKDFSVQIASAYYGVLENRDATRNGYLNLESSRQAGDRFRALAAEGRTTQTDLGRIEQQELSSESAWVNAIRTYLRSLDDFKFQLGVPVDTKLVLDEHELTELTIRHPDMAADDAISIALSARLDYQNARDQVQDTEREVKVAVNRLLPQVDFIASAGFTSVKSDHGFPLPDPSRYNYSAGLTVDLPIDRVAERNAYRSALITEAQAKRSYEQTRDQIELQVRESWRTLEQDRRNYEINLVGVKLAERRVEEQDLLSELGRAKALDQVDAQNSLLSSKDQLTQALVSHTIARLQFWDNMGILYIKDDGQWRDFN
jgi:outer membrane protein TolC